MIDHFWMKRQTIIKVKDLHKKQRNFYHIVDELKNYAISLLLVLDAGIKSGYADNRMIYSRDE